MVIFQFANCYFTRGYIWDWTQRNQPPLGHRTMTAGGEVACAKVWICSRNCGLALRMRSQLLPQICLDTMFGHIGRERSRVTFFPPKVAIILQYFDLLSFWELKNDPRNGIWKCTSPKKTNQHPRQTISPNRLWWDSVPFWPHLTHEIALQKRWEKYVSVGFCSHPLHTGPFSNTSRMNPGHSPVKLEIWENLHVFKFNSTF